MCMFAKSGRVLTDVGRSSNSERGRERGLSTLPNVDKQLAKIWNLANIQINIGNIWQILPARGAATKEHDMAWWRRARSHCRRQHSDAASISARDRLLLRLRWLQLGIHSKHLSLDWRSTCWASTNTHNYRNRAVLTIYRCCRYLLRS